MSNTTLKEVQDIHQQIAALQERATLLMQEGRADAIEQIKTMIAAYQIAPAELDLVLKPAPRVRPAKYRDPVSGKQWSGQGIAPKWIENQDRTVFLIAAAP